MKKRTNILLITACALIILGAVISIGTLIAVDFDFTRLSITRSIGEKQSAEFPAGDISSIAVCADVDDVNIRQSDGDMIYVTYYTSEYADYDLKTEDGTLSLTYNQLKKKRWYEYLWNVNFDFSDEDTFTGVEIEVPAGFAGTLDISASVGDICFAELSLEGEVSVSVTVGDVTLYNITAESASVTTTTGDINVFSCGFVGRAELTTSAGDQGLDGVTSGSAIVCTAQTGDIQLASSDAPEISANCVTGDITAYYVDADSVALSATTGDISAELIGSASDYDVTTSTDTGDVYSEGKGNSTAPRTVTAATTTGDVEIKFTGK
jgi:hypothetical protein